MKNHLIGQVVQHQEKVKRLGELAKQSITKLSFEKSEQIIINYCVQMAKGRQISNISKLEIETTGLKKGLNMLEKIEFPGIRDVTFDHYGVGESSKKDEPIKIYKKEKDEEYIPEVRRKSTQSKKVKKSEPLLLLSTRKKRACKSQRKQEHIKLSDDEQLTIGSEYVEDKKSMIISVSGKHKSDHISSV
jgi:hypothetical protein